MRATSIASLRHSIRDSVWSNKEGANKVLQEAWEKKPAEAKILFIWSITHRSSSPLLPLKVPLAR